MDIPDHLHIIWHWTSCFYHYNLWRPTERGTSYNISPGNLHIVQHFFHYAAKTSIYRETLHAETSVARASRWEIIAAEHMAVTPDGRCSRGSSGRLNWSTIKWSGGDYDAKHIRGSIVSKVISIWSHYKNTI